MIYLILFGLDMYSGLTTVLFFLTLIMVILTVVSGFMMVMYEDSDQVYDYKQDPTIRLTDEGAIYWLRAKTLFSYRYIALCLCLLLAVLPNKDTIRLAIGIYAGEVIYTQVKDNPLAIKAYNIAEQKLNELLNDLDTKKELK